MAQAPQRSSTEVALHYRRPSSVLTTLKGLEATLVAHDDRGTVGIVGAPADVEVARQALRLSDVPRKTLLLRVTVESPADHLSWEVDARLVNGQKWRTADEETGAEVALEPWVDASGALSVRILARCGGAEITSQFRIRKGSARAIELGARRTENVEIGLSDVKATGFNVPLPKVTVRYIGG